MKRNISIIIIGDSGVGKSTLISSFISKQFSEEVPQILTEADIPPENSSNNIRLTIIDTAGSHLHHGDLRRKIANADCVVVLHDLSRPNTLENLKSIWLPKIRLIGEKPVVVVGTKSDIITNVTSLSTASEENVLQEFPFVSRCCRCSSKDSNSLDNVFRNVETAVNYPLSPIFDIRSHTFTTCAIRAFKRIFRILDINMDGFLSDTELNEFQLNCFGLILKKEEIQDIKKLIRRASDEKDGVIAVSPANDMITYCGFERLMQLFVDRELIASIWTILELFDYDQELQLQIPDFNSANMNATNTMSISALSHHAAMFLKSLPYIVNKSKTNINTKTSTTKCVTDSSSDTIIGSDALEEVLSVLSEECYHPWKPFLSENVFNCDGTTFILPRRRSGSVSGLVGDVNGDGHSGRSGTGSGLSEDSWLLHWTLLAARKPVMVQTLLFCLGYDNENENDEDNDNHGVIYRPQLSELSSHTSPAATSYYFNSTSVAIIIGGSRCGKSSLIAALGGATPSPNTTPKYSNQDVSISHAVSSRHWWGGVRRVIVWVEDMGHTALFVPTSYDIVVILINFEDPRSFSEAMDFEANLPSRMPRIFVISKAKANSVSGGHSQLAANSRSNRRRSSTTDAVDTAVADETETETYRDTANALKRLTDFLAEHDLPKLIWVSAFTGEGLLELKALVSSVAESPESAIHRSVRQGGYGLYWLIGGGLTTLVMALGVVTFVMSRNRAHASRK